MLTSDVVDMKHLLLYNVFIFVVKGYIHLNVSSDTSKCLGSSFNMSCVVDNQTTTIQILKPDGLYVGYCLAPLGGMDTVCTSTEPYKSDVSKSETSTMIVLTIPSLNKSEHSGIWRCEHGDENSSVGISVISTLMESPVIITSPVNGGTVSNATINGHVYCQNTELTSELLYAHQVGQYEVLDPQPIWSDEDIDNNVCDFEEKDKIYTTNVTRTMSALRGKRVTFKIRLIQPACNSSFTTNSSPVFFFPDPPEDKKTLINGNGAGSSLSLTEGENRTLQCEVNGGVPLAVIKWNCFGGVVTNTSVEGIARSNITFTITDSQNGKLCTCSATHPVAIIAETSVRIHIAYAANITSMDISGGNFTVREHSTPTITCNVEGSPLPLIKLRYIRNNTVIAKTTGTRLQYQFPYARCEDTGQYRCEANNSFQLQLHVIKEVYVLCYPRLLNTTYQDRQLSVRLGESLRISTMYLAYPKPEFKWFFQLTRLSNRSELTNHLEDVEISEIDSDSEIFRHGSHLVKKSLKAEDFGIYSITARNGVNVSIYDYNVEVKENLFKRSIIGVAAGAVLGAVAFILLVVIILIYLLRRRKRNSARANDTKSKIESSLNSRQNDDNDEGSSRGNIGEKDNHIVETNFAQNQETSERVEFSIVDNQKKREINSGGGKHKQKHKKSSFHAYKNIEMANCKSNDKEMKTDEKENKASTNSSKSKDGLIYIDVDIQEPINSGTAPIIHGEKDQTNYIEIDFTKSANQLPSDSGNKDGHSLTQNSMYW